MADVGAIDDVEALEDDYAKWATEWDEADDTICVAYLKIARIRREELELLKRIGTGGRYRKREA